MFKLIDWNFKKDKDLKNLYLLEVVFISLYISFFLELEEVFFTFILPIYALFIGYLAINKSGKTLYLLTLSLCAFTSILFSSFYYLNSGILGASYTYIDLKTLKKMDADKFYESLYFSSTNFLNISPIYNFKKDDFNSEIAFYSLFQSVTGLIFLGVLVSCIFSFLQKKEIEKKKPIKTEVHFIPIVPLIFLLSVSTHLFINEKVNTISNKPESIKSEIFHEINMISLYLLALRLLLSFYHFTLISTQRHRFVLYLIKTRLIKKTSILKVNSIFNYEIFSTAVWFIIYYLVYFTPKQ